MPGFYWYHPHMREDMLKDLGLYGNLMVRASAEEYGPANREEVLMLDDMEIAAEGVVPYGPERATHALMGRFGNVLLVNGRTDWSLEVDRGEVVRFFLTNVTNARTFNVSFGDARIKVLGSDVSNFEREEWVESVVVRSGRALHRRRADSIAQAGIRDREPRAGDRPHLRPVLLPGRHARHRRRARGRRDTRPWRIVQCAAHACQRGVADIDRYRSAVRPTGRISPW